MTDGLLLGRIVIERRMHPDGTDGITIDHDDGTGRPLDLITTLGMLALAREAALAHDDGTFDCDCHDGGDDQEEGGAE